MKDKIKTNGLGEKHLFAIQVLEELIIDVEEWDKQNEININAVTVKIAKKIKNNDYLLDDINDLTMYESFKSLLFDIKEKIITKQKEIKKMILY